MQLGDMFIRKETGCEYRLNDIDFGWYQLGVKGFPDDYVWIKGKEDMLKEFEKVS